MWIGNVELGYGTGMWSLDVDRGCGKGARSWDKVSGRGAGIRIVNVELGYQSGMWNWDMDRVWDRGCGSGMWIVCGFGKQSRDVSRGWGRSPREPPAVSRARGRCQRGGASAGPGPGASLPAAAGDNALRELRQTRGFCWARDNTAGPGHPRPPGGGAPGTARSLPNPLSPGVYAWMSPGGDGMGIWDGILGWDGIH